MFFLFGQGEGERWEGAESTLKHGVARQKGGGVGVCEGGDGLQECTKEVASRVEVLGAVPHGSV